MKGFAVVLLCAFVVQGRSAVDVARISGGSPVQLGESPSVVHLRLATSNGEGFLNSCAGSLIDNSWILTSANCVQSSTFTWVRYGAVSVLNPSLVIETSTVIRHPSDDIALIRSNRHVEENDNIKISKIANAADLGAGRFCGYGEKEDNSAGEILKCLDLAYHISGDNVRASVSATKYDTGAPLFNVNGEQIGLLSSSDGEFLQLSRYRQWINEQTDLNL